MEKSAIVITRYQWDENIESNAELSSTNQIYFLQGTIRTKDIETELF